ncbi:diaminopimelate decarboxylase [Bifidobacterium sp. ESL0745]|uniref:diaminopimelate decarboxylase family protein n=1 Tax=Bifidobacterium sp. ESL0745 TaxID=2983226 RepID=UPI0023F9761B|nr:diaminopimelate decarboxylase [Bifidobacterium sp. ESL0745]MDF7665622.1 diaminopimelate decarboxylase [Bifidobacterium sp. ESL0745]
MGITPIWPEATAFNKDGELMFHGHSAASLLDEFGSPLYLIDTDEVRNRARKFVAAAAKAFNTNTTHVSFAGKAFLSKEIVRIVTQAGMHVDTCSMGEIKIALAAGAPGRRLVLHGNNKSDEEIELAIKEGFSKIVVDSPDEPARIAAIAHRLGKRARVMLRVTSGIHAGGHEYISTAHEDQKFGVPLLPAGVGPEMLDILGKLGNENIGDRDGNGNDSAANAGSENGCGRSNANHSIVDAGSASSENHVSPVTADSGLVAGSTYTPKLDYSVKYPYDMSHVKVSDEDRELAEAMNAVADGPALAVLKDIYSRQEDLELVGIHSHIGSQIHDANAFIEAARRMMLLRKTFYATDACTMPEVDLGGGYSVAYTDAEDSMDIDAELGRLAQAVTSINKALGMPAPVISFEPGRWIVAPAGVTLYRVGTIKHVALPKGTKDEAGNPIDERTYVSVDGGMSDNIRPALYGADYTALLANRDCGGAKDENGNLKDSMLARVVGMHCESGDILVKECHLPRDLKRGDILAIPVTGAYGRTMASNYNQALIPAVVAVSGKDAHLMLRRQTIDDLLALDVS